MKITKKLSQTKLDNNESKFNTVDKVFILSVQEYEKYKSAINFNCKLTDFAIACSGASSESTAIITRSHYQFSNKTTSTYKGLKVFVNGETKVCSLESSGKLGGQPAFKMSVEEFKKLNLPVDVNGNVDMPHIEFPQRIVKTAEVISELDKAFKQSKTTPQLLPGVDCKVFVYNNEKYARIVAKADTTFLNGDKCEKGKVYYSKFEPVSFTILNYENSRLSKQNGENELLLMSSAPIIAGVSYSALPKEEFGNLWMNSQYRAYLNGISIHKDLATSNVSNVYKLPKDCNFERNSFIDFAFVDPNAKKTEKTIIQSTSKKDDGAFGLKPIERPRTNQEQLQFYFDHRMSCMLHGPSGVGKTRRVRDLDPDCIMLKLRKGMMPEEIIGKTIFKEDSDEPIWRLPVWYKEICKVCKKQPDRNHILLIDELTNVGVHEQDLVYDIVLEHTLVGPSKLRLPENCVVFTTGNSPEESEAAYNMPEPLFRRAVAHMYYTPNVPDFLAWGCQLKKDNPSQTNIHPAVLSFIADRGKKVLFTSYWANKENEIVAKYAVDPRSWEQVSDILYADSNIDENLITNKTGPELAQDFVKYVFSYRITVDDILAGTFDASKLPRNEDQKLALVNSLRNVDIEDFDTVRNFVEKFVGAEFRAILDSLWIEGDDEKALYFQEKYGDSTDNEIDI